MATPDRRHHLLGASVLAVVIWACPASLPAAATSDDPLESINRAVFNVNRQLDRYALRPTTVAYRAAVPATIRQGFAQFLDNLLEPVHALNAGLQGDLHGVEVAFARFLLNTIVGLGGFLDIATHAGVYPEPRGFGQTLAGWGVERGPYLVLPVLGPSTLRELGGLMVDTASAPHRYVFPTSGDTDTLFRTSETVLRALTFREEHFEQIDVGFAHSLDAYASARSIYLQTLNLSDAPEGGPFLDQGLDFDDFDQ